MIASKHFFIALASLLAIASTAPTELDIRDTVYRTIVSKVSTSINFGGSCVMFLAGSDQCFNFLGGLTVLNKTLSSAVVPGGVVCTFFEKYGCQSAGTSQTDEVALVAGNHPKFGLIPGMWGSQSFDDLASSFSCSPV